MQTGESLCLEGDCQTENICELRKEEAEKETLGTLPFRVTTQLPDVHHLQPLESEMIFKVTAGFRN